MAPVRCRKKSSRPIEARTFVFTSCGCQWFRVTTRTRPAASPGALHPAVLAISMIRIGARGSHSLRTTFISENLVDAGLRKATVQQYRAIYENTVAQYRQTVLTAFQQV